MLWLLLVSLFASLQIFRYNVVDSLSCGGRAAPHQSSFLLVKRGQECEAWERSCAADRFLVWNLQNKNLHDGSDDSRRRRGWTTMEAVTTFLSLFPCLWRLVMPRER
ncbi:hypothetical protein O6H91_02G090000 [Diphasiastrum complanatum]|uniref:Uncharacterized protein n=1 Tax=Diphasiastrum complanatum TaxID=34168 RepID=A0ACC2EI11_DIPCM|nr:hypothetical protein O6H91_02G090000 [Diphasiastrum complanatum]